MRHKMKSLWLKLKLKYFWDALGWAHAAWFSKSHSLIPPHTVRVSHLQSKAKAHDDCAHAARYDRQATTWVLTLFAWKRPVGSCCLAFLLTVVKSKIYFNAARQVCLRATMLTRQKFVLICLLKPLKQRRAHAYGLADRMDDGQCDLSILQTESETSWLLLPFLSSWLTSSIVLQRHF